METFLENLTTSDVWVALVSFITANLGTIIGMIIYAVKQGLKRSASQEEYQKQCEAYVEEAREAANKAIDKTIEISKELQVRINEALKIKTAEEKAELEAQSLKLTETINEAKKALSVDEILEEIAA